MPRIRFQMALAYFCDGRLNEVERVFQRWLDEGGGESADQKSAFQLSALMSIAYRLMEQDEKAESLRDIAKDYLSTLNVPEMNHVLALCDWTLGGDSPERAELHVGINTRLWMNEVGSVVRRFRGNG